MEMIETDVLVAGGGLAGLAATARFAAAGLETVCIDPMPRSAEGPDLRTTAFLGPSVETLESAGAWHAMEAGAEPLRVMRIVDAGGRERRVRETCDFEASELRPGPFGYNVTNRNARRALLAAIEDQPRARLLDGARVDDLLRQTRDALAILSDGRRVRARLAVAADGRDSRLRRSAGIPARRWDYGQQALVFAVAHPEPHDGISTEIHRTGGPLTLVPMPDRDGRHMSSVVWMMPGPRAERVAAMSDAALGAEITADTMGLFGPLEPVGERASWPMIGQMAMSLHAERLALVAESAHVIPPIGAQGLNMSLADVETLAGLMGRAQAAGRDIGDDQVLRQYEALRFASTGFRVAGVDMLNRFAKAEMQPLRDLRRLGLAAIHRIEPVRHIAMRLGMAAR